MAQPQVLEGTWEEIKLHEEELAGKRFRLVPVPPVPVKAVSEIHETVQNKSQESYPPLRQLTGMGKFAGIMPGSEEFMRQKQEEIELEERKFKK